MALAACCLASWLKTLASQVARHRLTIKISKFNRYLTENLLTSKMVFYTTK